MLCHECHHHFPHRGTNQPTRPPEGDQTGFSGRYQKRGAGEDMTSPNTRARNSRRGFTSCRRRATNPNRQDAKSFHKTTECLAVKRDKRWPSATLDGLAASPSYTRLLAKAAATSCPPRQNNSSPHQGMVWRLPRASLTDRSQRSREDRSPHRTGGSSHRHTEASRYAGSHWMPSLPVKHREMKPRVEHFT